MWSLTARVGAILGFEPKLTISINSYFTTKLYNFFKVGFPYYRI
jgi:hypothetical protein